MVDDLVARDDSATTTMNTPVTVPVLANDTLDGAPVSLGDLGGPPTIVSPPSVGEASVNPDGSITYTPPDGFTGEVEFQYMIEGPEPQVCQDLFFTNGYINISDFIDAFPDFHGDTFHFQLNGETFEFSDSGFGGRWHPNGDVQLPCCDFLGQVTVYWGEDSGCANIYSLWS